MSAVNIPLTQGRVALIDAADLPLVADYTWCAQKIGRTFYAVAYCGTGRKDNRTVLLHRFLTNPAAGFEVHHRDGDGLNNQRANLEVLTRGRHLTFAQRPNSSGYRGVRLLTHGAWQAYQAVICQDGERFYLGCFKTAHEAAAAYNRKARELYGPDAYQNVLL